MDNADSAATRIERRKGISFNFELRKGSTGYPIFLRITEDGKLLVHSLKEDVPVGSVHSSTDGEKEEAYHQGVYWTSTMPKVGPFYGYCLLVGESSIRRSVSYRQEGLAIRPVLDESVE